MMTETDQLFNNAIEAARTGDRKGARGYLAEIIKREARNARAWYLMSQVVDERERIVYCLNQVLDIEPENQQAKEKLASMQGEIAKVEAPEIVYYQDVDITVTNKRVSLSGKTYSMANITSVAMHIEPANRTSGYTAALFGLLIVACSFIFGKEGIIGVIGGLVVLVIGIAYAYDAKTKYFVRIGSASGESNALWHYDKAYIQKVVDAVNEAIVKRG